MARLWEDERYVKLYVRDTINWTLLSYDAQSLVMHLLRKVNRAGVLEIGPHGARGLAVLLRHPDSDRLQKTLDELTAAGTITIRSGVLTFPNFIDAQESKQSDKARQAKSRELARLKALGFEDLGSAVSQNVTDCHDVSRDVTDCHDLSQPVTTRLAVPCCAETRQIKDPIPPSAAVSDAPVREKPKSASGKKKKEPESPSDPRRAPLIASLCSAFLELRKGLYDFKDSLDGKAVNELLRKPDGSPEEVLRRWRMSLVQENSFNRCENIFDLSRKWNFYAGEGPPKPWKREPDKPDPRKGSFRAEDADKNILNQIGEYRFPDWVNS